MIAAIYSRKSTEQNVGDESKSVRRQIEHARHYAAEKGWRVDDQYIFVDDGISGMEFLRRPGFIRLMNAVKAKPKPPFQILIMAEESRLGREAIQTAYVVQQILEANIRIFYYLENQERTLNTPIEKAMMALSNFSDEMERERARQRTYDALKMKALAGYVTGGTVYGYINQEVCSADGRRLYVRREKNEHEAAIVQKIFTLYAGGLGLTRIAKRLNADGIPAPRQSPHGWAPTCVRELLHRRLYAGEIIWNESQKIVRGGTKKRRRRDEKEWIRVPAPNLRIVPENLWNAVQVRLARTKDRARPALRDVESKYLLTGLARCKHCGGPLSIVGRVYHRQRGRFYGCAYNWKRGTCKNSLLVEQEVFDQVILKAITDVLDEKMVKAAVEKALQRLRAGQDMKLTERSSIERELSLIEAHEKHLVDAIVDGEPSAPLVNRLKVEEARKKELLAKLEGLSAADDLPDLDEARLRRDLKNTLAETKDLLGRYIPQTREILRLLLEGPLLCETVVSGNRPGYRVTGQGTLRQFLPSPLAALMVVSPTGTSEGGNAALTFTIDVKVDAA